MKTRAPHDVRGRGFLFPALLMALWIPILGGIFGVPDVRVKELRDLAPWPRVASTPWSHWPAAFEAWVNDHYPLRGWVIRSDAVVVHRWLKQPSPSVVVGSDGWLFYTGEKTLDDWVGRDPLTDAELKAWAAALRARQDFWRQRGATYLFVLVPNKSTIYPERMPGRYQTQRAGGRLDQLVAYLRVQAPAVPVVDLRPVLLTEKPKHVVYWPNDSHWNAWGLSAACTAIIARADELGAPHGPDDTRNWVRIEDAPREGDCVRLLRLNGAWPSEPMPQLRLEYPPDLRQASSTLPASAGPEAFERGSGRGRTVLICDSFFRLGGLAAGRDAQVPLLLQFGRFVSIWPWEGETNRANRAMLVQIAEQEKPTLVVEEYTERFLKTVPPM